MVAYRGLSGVDAGDELGQHTQPGIQADEDKRNTGTTPTTRQSHSQRHSLALKLPSPQPQAASWNGERDENVPDEVEPCLEDAVQLGVVAVAEPHGQQAQHVLTPTGRPHTQQARHVRKRERVQERGVEQAERYVRL